MATTIVIIAAALVAAAVVVGVVVSRRQRIHDATERGARAGGGRDAQKMDELAGELSGALERAEQESRRNRLFGELGGSIDLEELMDRVLDAAMEIPGFDAAMMVVERQDGAPAVVTRGMTADESARPPTSGVVGTLPGHDHRELSLRTRSRGRGRRSHPRRRVRPAHGPRAASGGTLSLFWRSPDHEPSSARDRAGGAPRGELHLGDRERAPLRRGAEARGDGRAHGPLQPAVLPGDAAARGHACPPLPAEAHARRLRPRRLQVDQRPGRPPRRRSRARAGRGSAARGRPLGRRRLPHRRRRVRGDHARVGGRGRGAALPARAQLDARDGPRPRRAAPAPLGRHRRAPARRHAGEPLRARRCGALPREGARQGSRRHRPRRARSAPIPTPGASPRA